MLRADYWGQTTLSLSIFVVCPLLFLLVRVPGFPDLADGLAGRRQEHAVLKLYIDTKSNKYEGDSAKDCQSQFEWKQIKT